MSFEITVNIPGLKELAEAIGQIASIQRKEENVQETVPVQQPQPEQKPQPEAYGRQVAAHFPNANVSVPQQETVTPSAQPQPAVQETPPASQPQQPQQPQQPAVQTSVPTYTREELSKAAMLLMDKGMQAQLMQLIQSFGVQSLVELPPEQYGNFATGLRGMGAQI